MNSTASRTDAPEVVTQKQLEDAKNIIHPRTGEEQDTVTQDQLKAKRKDAEPQQTTERQLDGKRKDDAPDVTTQKQLDGTRKDAEKDQVTQAQLGNEGYRQDKEREVVTEAQLEQHSGDFIWTRTAFNRTNIKTAEEHIAAVAEALGSQAAALKVDAGEVVDLIGSQLVDSIKSKTATLEAITGKTARGSFVEPLRALVASDERIDPETVAAVLEVLVEDRAEAIRQIEAAKQSALVRLAAQRAKPSKVSSVRAALYPKAEAAKSTSKTASLPKRATHIIEVTMDEVGCKLANNNEAVFRKAIVAYAKGVTAADKLNFKNGKFAGVTNVDIEEDKIRIAIAWDEDGVQKADISLDPGADIPTPTTPEGDMSGMEPPMPAPMPAPLGAPMGAPAGAPAPAPLAAAIRRQFRRTAQVPQGGGMGASNPTGGTGNPAEAMPTPPPGVGEQPGLQSLTQDEPAPGEAEQPGQFPPGSVCPFCGSNDVDLGAEGREVGVSTCKGCGAVYELHVNVEVLNPEKMSFDDEEKPKVEAPEEPSLPTMPVAAAMKLDAIGLRKVAECEAKHGDVCPACGQTDCKAKIKVAGHTEYTCPACETAVVKETLVNSKDPSDVQIRVAWTFNPSRQAIGCPDCREEAKRFAARLSVAKMVRKAEIAQRKSPFPKANCLERIARRWGANAVSTVGPCKGKPLADCVCKELEKLGFTSKAKLYKLANAYSQPDPYDVCLKKEAAKVMARGIKDPLTVKAMSCDTCNAMRKKFAEKSDKNLLLQAWSNEPGLDEFSLDAIDDNLHGSDPAELAPGSGADDLEGDISEPLPEAQTVSVELPVEIAKDIVEQVEAKTESEKSEVTEGAPPIGGVETSTSPGPVVDVKFEDTGESLGHTDATITSNTAKTVTITKEGTMQKEATKPTQVEHIDQGNATIPRSEQYLGKEKSADSLINATPKAPNIPRKDEKLGEEAKAPDAFLNKPNTLPDIPTGDAKIGGEKATQSGLPATNTQIKSTVIAAHEPSTETLQKEAAKPHQVEHITDSGNATIPSGKATLGKEGPENIDVKMSSPSIPSGKATLGHEGPDNINPEAGLPDVPTGDAKIGGETETQKGLPATNTDIKGTVIAKQSPRDRIDAARFKQAMLIASRYLAAGRIQENEFDGMIEDLSGLSLERQEAFAKHYGVQVQKTAAAAPVNAPAPVAALPVVTSAIIQEMSLAPISAPDPRQDLINSLSGMMTIGSRQLDEELRKRNER